MGIDKTIHLKKKFTLRRSELSNKFRVENNNLDISTLIETTGYEVKKIGGVALAHREERNKKETGNKTFKYVQISDIDVSLGRIKSFRRFKGSEAPNNARRIMHYGDVLVSTRRPTRGAVVSVPKLFDGDICTVFFTTLKIKDRSVVDPGYLALFLRTSLGRLQFQSLITETAYPVISDEDVESIVVLLPPIADQRKIAEEYDTAINDFLSNLNEAYSLITKARQEIETRILGEYAQEIERKKFGLDIQEITNEED